MQLIARCSGSSPLYPDINLKKGKGRKMKLRPINYRTTIFNCICTDRLYSKDCKHKKYQIKHGLKFRCSVDDGNKRNGS